MASSSSSSSIFVDSSSKVIITEEEFKNFHNIDRKLFLRLVTNNLIGQEPRRVTLFMALFLWFEKTTKNFTLISKLLQWPDTLLTDLTNEAAFIFTCIDDNDAIECFTKNNVNYSKYCDLPLTQKITNSGITLHFVHQNRVDIKQAIDKLINSVCDRAFDDIIVKFLLQKQAEKEHALHYNPMMLPPPHEVGPPQVLPLKVVVPAPAVDEGSSSSGGLGDASEVKVLTNGVCEIPRRVELRVGGAGERRHVAEDDRTVFLTFSKGYPISESEIIEFFYRRYGDIIEAVIMQEVQSVVEQPLYARLVLRPDFIDMLQLILDRTTHKAKFCINGKHVWARKFVPKTSKSLPNSPLKSITF